MFKGKAVEVYTMNFSAMDYQRGELAGNSESSAVLDRSSLLNFVFGNVDSSMQLEGNDLLDEDAKRMLFNLSRDVSDTVKQIVNPSDLLPQNLSEDDKIKLRSTVEDYYAIDETIPTPEPAFAPRTNPLQNYEPNTSSTSGTADGMLTGLTSSSVPTVPRNDVYKSLYSYLAPGLSLPPSLPARLSLPQTVDDITSDKPLASLLPPEMMDVDVRDVYPDFNEDKPLRWNRLFRGQIEPRFLPPEPSATQPAADRAAETREYHVIVPSSLDDEDGMPIARDSSGYSFEEIFNDLAKPWCPIAEYKSKADDSFAPHAQSSFDSDGGRPDMGSLAYNWRHGATECWYDKAGISETGHEYFNRVKKAIGSEAFSSASATTGTDSGMVVDDLDDDEDGQDAETTNDALAAKDFLQPFNLSELNPEHDGPWLTSYLYEWEKDVPVNTDSDGGADSLNGRSSHNIDKHQSLAQRQWQIHVQRMRNMPWTSTYMMAKIMHARQVQIEQQKTGNRNQHAANDPYIDAILARYNDEELSYFQNMAMSQKSMVNEVDWESDVLKFVQDGILPPPQPPLFFIRDFRTCLFKPDESKLYKTLEWRELQRKREECYEYVNIVTPANSDIALVVDGAGAAARRPENHLMPKSSSRGSAAAHHFKSVLQLGRQDFLNVSKDAEYYRSSVKQTATAVAKSALKVSALSATHAIPAMQLYPAFFPPNWNRDRLKNFHRIRLRLPQRTARGVCKPNTPHRFEVVTKYELRATQRRQKLLAKLGGGTVMHMRQPHDLSAKDSEILLFEYSEEFPPLVLQPGMAANVLNYARYPSSAAEYNPKLGENYEYGTLTYCKKSPFLGQIGEGKVVQTIESSVFRAPIYQHEMPTTDFLVIRNKKKYFIRRVARIFCVGQECPLVEVPSPKSKRAVAIQQNFIQSRMWRLFNKTNTQPARLDFADLTRMFTHQDGLLRKKLRGFAKQEKQGKTTMWILNKDYKLPQEEEIRELCRPDDYCALYSMRCAEQRLRDAGYGEAMEKLLLLDDEAAGEKSLEEKTDDEIKAAPWNTTRAFLSAMQGKCMLEVQGVADPTGCGEGISYTRLRTKGREKGTTRAEALARRLRKAQMAEQRSTVSGTQADLRKLTLQEARKMLSDHGFTKDTIQKFKRWEAIHLIRQVGIHQARAGQGGTFAKFSRGPKKSIQELMIKFRNDSQKVFTVQHQTLSATAADNLSDDESDDGGDDSTNKDKDDGMAAGITSASAGEIDWDAVAQQLHTSMAQRGKSKHQIEHELEEKERRILKQLLTESSEAAKKQAGGADAQTGGNVAVSTATSSNNNLGKLTTDAANRAAGRPAEQNRKLKIRRTYMNPETNIPYWRDEVVNDAAIIDLYMRLRNAKSKSLLQRLLGVNEPRGVGISAAQARIRRSEAGGATKGAAQFSSSGGGVDMDSAGGGAGRAEEPPRRGRRPLPDKEKGIRKFKKELQRRDRDREREKNQSVQCSACLQYGHMRSNRICPRYEETYGPGALLRKGRPGAFEDDDLDMDDFGAEEGNVVGGNTLLLNEFGGPSGAGAVGTDVKNEHAVFTSGAESASAADEGGVRVEGTKLVFTKKLVESAQEDLQKNQQLKREEDEKQRLLREDLTLSDEDSDEDDEDKVFGKAKNDADYRPPLHASILGTGAPDKITTASEGGGLILKIRRDSFMINDTGGTAVNAELSDEAAAATDRSPVGTYTSPSTRSDGGVHTPVAGGGSGSVGSGGERKLIRGSRRGGRSSANINEDVAASGRAKRGRPESPSDLYSRPFKQVHQRWRTDPFVFINSRFDAVIKELRLMPEARLFLMPVRDVELPDYRTHVLNPMDLNTMRLRVKRGAEPMSSMSSLADENDERMLPGNVYRSRAEFLADLQQIVRNSELYNGPGNEITNNARRLLAIAHARLYESEKVSEELSSEERRIDPLVDPDAEPVQCLNQYLQQVVEQAMKVDSTQQKIFCKPVSLKLLPDYAVKVARPIDLSLIFDLCKRRNYKRLDEFRADIELIRFNSQTYNGSESQITHIAGKLVDYALAKLDSRKEMLQHVEARIQEQKQMEAIEAAATAAAMAEAAFTATAESNGNFMDEVFSSPSANPSEIAAEQKRTVESEAAGILEDLELSDEEDESESQEAYSELQAGARDGNFSFAPYPRRSPFEEDVRANVAGDVANEDNDRSARMMMDVDDESVLARWRANDDDDVDGNDYEAEYAGDNDESLEADHAMFGGASTSSRRRYMGGGMSKPSSERVVTYSEANSPDNEEDNVSRSTRDFAASIGLPIPSMNYGLRTNRRAVDEYNDDSDDELVVAPEDRIQQAQMPLFIEDDDVDESMFVGDNDADFDAADLFAGDGSTHMNAYAAAPSSPALMMRSVGGAVSPADASVRQRPTSGENLSDEDDEPAAVAAKPTSPVYVTQSPENAPTTFISHGSSVQTGVQQDVDNENRFNADDEFGDLLTFDSAARIAGYADESDREAEQPPTSMTPAAAAPGSNFVSMSSTGKKETGETLSDSSDEDAH